MKNVCVFLADGYEEIEALTVVDILRRAGIDTKMVSISDEKKVVSSHKIAVEADTTFDAMNFSETQMLVLPGGIPGTPNLQAHEGLTDLLKEFYANGKYIAAICAAPSIFGALGFLKGRKACSHSSREDKLEGATVVRDSVVVSDHIIMSRGMGTAIDFALKMVEILDGQEKAEEISRAIHYHS
ncbi:MAG: DJ-1/PfpI family protein [Hespellia sp.]|nr:DJ-1/PfpI family protein [Hespellia sp.]